MADDDFQNLINARAALAKKRVSLAQTIATDGNDSAISAMVDVQRAIEVIDIAIEELEEAELEDELEETEDEDE